MAETADRPVLPAGEADLGLAPPGDRAACSTLEPGEDLSREVLEGLSPTAGLEPPFGRRPFGLLLELPDDPLVEVNGGTVTFPAGFDDGPGLGLPLDMVMPQ